MQPTDELCVELTKVPSEEPLEELTEEPKE